MAYENLKNAIKQVIKQNGNQEITGSTMQSTLLSIVNAMLEVVQESGKAEDKVMSQKATTDAIQANTTAINDFKSVTPSISDTAAADFEIAGDGDFVLAQFVNGHIKTKNFDSSSSIGTDRIANEAVTDEKIANGAVTDAKLADDFKSVTPSISDTATADLEIAGDGDLILAQFVDGHIKTKNFDSSKIRNNEIKILFIGNSLTQDAVAYVPLLLKEIAPELKFKIYDWYNAGRTLLQQYNEFFITNKACEIFSTFDSSNSTQWENLNNTVTIFDVLKNCDFDIVVLQEYSYYDFDETQCKTNFDNCANFIRDRYSKSLMFASFMDAPMRSRIETDFAKAKNYCTWHVKNSVSQGIIAAGAAVMYAMNTELDSLGDKGHLSADGTHTQEGLPCLLQSYVIALWIFEKLGIPKSVINSKTRITQEVWNSLNPQGPNLGSGVITGTNEQHYIAQECAVKALKLSKKLLIDTFINF